MWQVLDDYRADQRGDVGSWVRTAGMAALANLIIACPSSPQHHEDLLIIVFGGMLKQAVEKIDSVREVAGQQLYRAFSEVNFGNGRLPSQRLDQLLEL